MASAARPEDFFREAEAERGWRDDDPDWLTALRRAHDLELNFKTKEAKAALAEATVPDEAFARVSALLSARIAVREATPATLAEAVNALDLLLGTLPADETATRARAQHLRATAMVRLGRLEEAETALSEAIALLDPVLDDIAFVRIADTLGQVLIGQGAWVEAARTLTALVAKRKAMDDPIGVAISAGHLARLHTSLGRAEEGAALAEEVLALLGPGTPPLTRLRMQTLLVTALVELPGDPRLAEATNQLEALAKTVEDDTHYLRGYACLTLARALALLGKSPQAWLDEAAKQFTLPAHVSLLRYHSARINPAELAAPNWLSEQEKLWAQVQFVSEAEIESRLLHARASENLQQLRERLDKTYARAIESNNALWMRWLDEAASELDPMLFSDRLALRYSGRARADLMKTVREDATIIFADLVGFTPRSLVLSPEEVMDTVRGLFELGVPLLAKYKVQPLTYMGDGLLAIAQGAEHERRGLAFARELVARTGRITRVREVLGSGLPLHLRAGVASGTVVLGSLGSLFKTEFAAIGATTNLAARLQAKAEPGEVVCARHTALAAHVSDAKDETFELKGYEGREPVLASRIVVTR